MNKSNFLSVTPQKTTGAKLKGTVATFASLCIVCALFFIAPGCNKDESLIDRMSITDLVDQDLVSYEGIGKIETLWEEGCGKDLNERMEEELPQIITRGLSGPGQHPSYYDVGVVRLGPNCGEYPTLRIFMDCQDSNPITSISRHIYESNYGNYWLTNYGMQVVGTKKDIQMYFCLVPYHTSIWPSARLDPTTTWGVLSLRGTGGINTGVAPSETIFRFFDNEDSNNVNSGEYSYPIWGYTNTAGIYPKYVNGNTIQFEGVFQNHDTELAFHRFTGSPYNFPTINMFPDFGFNYGVFSKKPVAYGTPVDRVYIDDEDTNNINKWGYNTRASIRAFFDYDFINGSNDTELYVTPAFWKGKILY
jgi:hypothetical protein